MTIWLKENKIDKLLIWPSPQDTLTPIPQLHPEQKTLKDFYWYDYMRPLNKDDIYTPVRRKTQDIPKRSDKFRNLAPE